MRGQALIFDLDGVIVDSNPVHVRVWEEYLAPYGIDTAGIDRRMHGLRNDEIVRDLFGLGLAEDEVSAHGARKESLYRQAMRPQLAARLVPGIAAFLERHRHIPMAVASNAEPANVRFVLEESGLARYFRAAVDGDQVSRPKPDPAIYRLAAGLLGVPASSCVVFEDSRAGIQAARDAGALVVGVAPDGRPPEKVDFAIRDFLDPELDGWMAQQMQAFRS